MAPPSTPRRFLAPPRPATQSGTPRPRAGGTPQFQATPRFSLASTPRGAPASTPAPSSAVFPRRRRESISDVLDSPPPPSRGVPGSIEIDSSPPPASPAPSRRGSSPPEAADAPPWPKRRRLSASWPPPARDAPAVASIRGSPSSPSGRDEAGPDVPAPDAAAEDAWEEPPAVGDRSRSPLTQRQQQPTFRPVPRFKPADVPEGGPHEPLPDVFSPRRRGDKFVPGGLAAGLRDWLMELESSTGAKKDGDWAARVRVDQVRAGAGMRLVHGRCVEGDGDGREDAGPDAAPTQRMRLVLAGEGRLAGLARRNEVTAGSVLGLAKPLWEVGLGCEGQWVMACDWKVL